MVRTRQASHVHAGCAGAATPSNAYRPPVSIDSLPPACVTRILRGLVFSDIGMLTVSTPWSRSAEIWEVSRASLSVMRRVNVPWRRSWDRTAWPASSAALGGDGELVALDGHRDVVARHARNVEIDVDPVVVLHRIEGHDPPAFAVWPTHFPTQAVEFTKGIEPKHVRVPFGRRSFMAVTAPVAGYHRR